MSTSPVNLNSSSLPVSSPAASSSSPVNASGQQAMDALGNPDTFLKLLVAQLQYQDPQSPADGTAFVTQLATFSGVEEQSAMRSDLDSINTLAQKWAAGQATVNAAATPAPATPAGTGSTAGADAIPAAGDTANPAGASN